MGVTRQYTKTNYRIKNKPILLDTDTMYIHRSILIAGIIILSFYIAGCCNRNGICEQYEDINSCVGDCWNPYNYNTSYSKIIAVLGQNVEHLCANGFSTVTDLNITCGNHICDQNENETTCPQDCNCFDENGILDRTKGVFGGLPCRSTYVWFPGYDLDISEVKAFFENVIGVDTDPTNNDAEIWQRIKIVWNWAANNKISQSYSGSNTETCGDYSNRRTIEILGEDRHQGYAIQTVPEVYQEYGGICYGSCTSHAHAMATYFLIAGIPETRVGTFGYSIPLVNSNHLYTGVLVDKRWIYLDFVCGGTLIGDTPYSKGCITSPHGEFIGYEGYEHPGGVASIKNVVRSVPVLQTCNLSPGVYRHRGNFEQAVGNLVIVNFDTLPNGSAINAPSPGVLAGERYSSEGIHFTSGVIFGDPNVQFHGISRPNVITNTSVNIPGVPLVSGYFSKPVCAIGITNTGAESVLRVYDAASRLIDFVNSDADPNINDFIGIVSTRPIYRFEFDFVGGIGFEGDDLVFQAYP